MKKIIPLALLALPLSSFALVAKPMNPEMDCVKKAEKNQKIQLDRIHNSVELANQLVNTKTKARIEPINADIEYKKTLTRIQNEAKINEIKAQTQFEVFELHSQAIMSNIDNSQKIAKIEEAARTKIAKIQEQIQNYTNQLDSNIKPQINSIQEQSQQEIEKNLANARQKESMVKNEFFNNIKFCKSIRTNSPFTTQSPRVNDIRYPTNSTINDAKNLINSNNITFRVDDARHPSSSTMEKPSITSSNVTMQIK